MTYNYGKHKHLVQKGRSFVLSKRLKNLRRERRLTQDELSTALGIKRNTYAQYETDNRTPDYPTLKAIADYYNESIDYLLGHTDERRAAAVHEDGMVYMPNAVRPNMDNLMLIPVVGTIRGGDPMLCEESIETYMYVDPGVSKISPEDRDLLYYLRVVGDSMTPKYQPGDLVLVRKQSDVDEGEVAVVLVDGESATLKKVYKVNGEVLLHSTNSNYEPLRIPRGQVRILGKALLRIG